ncbi:sensor domain-containing protein [Mycolicibacterium bacteremicum]|uniref:sensor domain-containing protein n=1 Tax=Mycolicibacterium bacteremicum TaxID=564198 RepID=UPI0026EA0B66|nr:sensor domain-containing protein [Mycolicibacterium bacteremicum]
MRTLALGALLLALTTAGCSADPTPTVSRPVTSVPDSALSELLLGPDAVDAVLGSTGITAHPQTDVMDDDRNLLPNLNCLGVWQVTEAPIYDPSRYTSVRRQLLRAPDTDDWDNLVVQAVVSYPTADAARDFFDDSARRWSKCTDHTVNVRVNDRQLPRWVSGDLQQTDTILAMPYTRGAGGQTRSCQRVLSVAVNIVLDIQACQPARQQPVTAATDIAEQITAKLAG